jgi:hypothetical protein
MKKIAYGRLRKMPVRLTAGGGIDRGRAFLVVEGLPP